ncbi:succinylglutamate desuccinylase [Serratia symbiotica]|uniref:succinylglutamate desuccinylase n=1 Tax=Serratia symbiotica TaxID=138074 RepID=UPI001327F1CF|nr:succinylglutamate desuccinylase [Serratia symbiotica]MBF1994218.1 succinylglutamate desuccinylase [Serratia symbiotica]QTP13527.1 succinylglutamate desuccinylase [Serratia symbiotica]
MFDLLSLTLAGTAPAHLQGETPLLRWRWLGEGLLEMTPQRHYRQAIVLSAGIHGNETAPIELLNQLVSELLAGVRPLAVRLLVVLGNPAAMRADKRYIHNDMNRLFADPHCDFSHSEETLRAQQLEQEVKRFFDPEAAERFHYDLHTAIRGSCLPRFALLPFQTRPYSGKMLAWLDAADLDALVMHNAPCSTFSYFSSKYFNAASCTLELGKARPFGGNDLSQFAAINHALQAMVSDEFLPGRSVSEIRVFRVAQSLIKRSEEVKLYLSDDMSNFTQLQPGTVLCDQPGERCCVNHDSAWILFPNPHVALGLRAGMLLSEVPRSTLY